MKRFIWMLLDDPTAKLTRDFQFANALADQDTRFTEYANALTVNARVWVAHPNDNPDHAARSDGSRARAASGSGHVGRPSEARAGGSCRALIPGRQLTRMVQGASVAIRGILVDLDETLYSRQEGFWAWVESEARDADVLGKLDRDKVAELDERGRGNKEVLLEYLDTTFHWNESQSQRLQRFRAGLAGAIRLASGVRELLVRLAARYRLGLVTNGTAITQRSKLDALGIATLFDPVVISEETGFRKPDVRAFEFAISGWGIPPESVLFVGDDLAADIHGAEAAGMQALQVGEHGISSFLKLERWLEEAST